MEKDTINTHVVHVRKRAGDAVDLAWEGGVHRGEQRLPDLQRDYTGQYTLCLLTQTRFR
jgi:hypothetical protein